MAIVKQAIQIEVGHGHSRQMLRAFGQIVSQDDPLGVNTLAEGFGPEILDCLLGGLELEPKHAPGNGLGGFASKIGKLRGLSCRMHERQ